MAQRGGGGADPPPVIDDAWLDLEIDRPAPPEPTRPRAQAPWLALLLGLFTTAAIVLAGWAAMSLLGDGARALFTDPTSIPTASTIASAPDPIPVSTAASTPAPTASPTTTSTVPTVDESLWASALAEAEAAAAAVAGEVAAASQAWEGGEAGFVTTRSRFVAAADAATTARSALAGALVPAGTDQTLVAALLEAFDELTVAAADTVAGLDAPDDGTLRRAAVDRTADVTAEIERLVEELREDLR